MSLNLLFDTQSAVRLAVALTLSGGVLLIYVHRAIELLGPRLLLASGAVVLGVGTIGLSRAQAPWELYASGVVMAIGWAATTTTAERAARTRRPHDR